MFLLQAQKNKLTVIERETLTSGSVNVYSVRFQFSPDWKDLVKTAVFECGGESRSIILNRSDSCSIPWEVLKQYGPKLYCGIYGSRRGEMILPTIWADLGPVQQGVRLSNDVTRPHTPGPYDQILYEIDHLKKHCKNPNQGSNDVIMREINDLKKLAVGYTHRQERPANVWRIVHNLRKFPSITVVDSAGSVVVGDVRYISDSEVEVSFVGSFSGKAYCN